MLENKPATQEGLICSLIGDIEKVEKFLTLNFGRRETEMKTEYNSTKETKQFSLEREKRLSLEKGHFPNLFEFKIKSVMEIELQELKKKMAEIGSKTQEGLLFAKKNSDLQEEMAKQKISHIEALSV